MKLEELTRRREGVASGKLEIPVLELCARFLKLYTGAVNDVMRELCLTDQALPYAIHPLRDEMKVCGPAFTVRSALDPTLSGEMETRVKMLEQLTPGCIIVWNANGDDDASHWGEVMTAASKKRGCAGAIVDGGIRDTAQILGQGYPIWYRYRTSNGSLSRCKITDVQKPIQVGRAFIRPDDILFADIDGAIVIPRERACEILTRAEKIKNNEIEIREWVDKGLSAAEIHDQGGYF
jgi:regulator of RNase E activity RraA